MAKRNISLKKGVSYSLASTLAITIILFALIWFIQENQSMKNQTKELTKRYNTEQKEYLVEEVSKAIGIINSIRRLKHDESESEVKEEVLTILADIRLKYGGYLFINQYDGQALIFDGEKVSGEKDLTNLTDPNGLRLFDIEKEAYDTPGGKFMEYLFKKMDSQIPEPKISYLKGYHEWGWIIGAGIYKHEPTLDFQLMQEGFRTSSQNGLILLISIISAMALLSFLLIRNINNRLHKQVKLINGFLNTAASTNDLIDIELLYYNELKSIGENLNKMICEKRKWFKQYTEKDQDIKSIFSAAKNVGFIITDLEGKNSKILEFSPGSENILGFKKDEVIGKEVSIIHFPGDEENFKRMQTIIASKNKGYAGETKLMRKDGTSLNVFFTLHPLFREGSLSGTIGVVIDISKRKKAEEELRALKENLEGKIEERTQELIDKNKELMGKNSKLEKFNDLFVGREFRIKELRTRITQLEKMIEQ